MVSYNELYSTLVNILECIHNEKKNLESQAQFELDKIEQQRKYLNNRDLKKELEIITAELEKEKDAYKKQLDDEIIKQKQVIQYMAKDEFKKYYNNELIEFNIKKEQNEKLRNHLFEEKRKLDEKQKNLSINIDNNHKKEIFLNELKENIYQEITKLAKERQIGFPLLAKAYVDLLKIKDERLIYFLEHKDRPAIKTAELLKEETRKRRDAEYRCKIAESINAFYETTFPYLLEFREELPICSESTNEYENYLDEERLDAVTLYLAPDEYRQLSNSERNQLALDRYKKKVMSKKEIGNMYERYIGYLYEKDGYDVSYVGILNGLEDLGRDLICRKNNDIKIIQCKNWSQYKDIFENNIFQFFGTVFKYKYDINDKDRLLNRSLFESIEGVFYTTTKLSLYAKEAARFLEINIKDNFKLDKNYPCIKCNISSSGEKIYHLPFDQQYDRIKITYDKGEFYCSTVLEAETAGFRRALRHLYHG